MMPEPTDEPLELSAKQQRTVASTLRQDRRVRARALARLETNQTADVLMALSQTATSAAPQCSSSPSSPRYYADPSQVQASQQSRFSISPDEPAQSTGIDLNKEALFESSPALRRTGFTSGDQTASRGDLFAEEGANMMNQTTEQAEVFHCCRAFIAVTIYCADRQICRSAGWPGELCTDCRSADVGVHA